MRYPPAIGGHPRRRARCTLGPPPLLRGEELGAEGLLVDLTHGVAGQRVGEDADGARQLVRRELPRGPAPQLDAQREARRVLRPRAGRRGLGGGGGGGGRGALGDDEGDDALA